MASSRTIRLACPGIDPPRVSSRPIPGIYSSSWASGPSTALSKVSVRIGGGVNTGRSADFMRHHKNPVCRNVKRLLCHCDCGAVFRACQSRLRCSKEPPKPPTGGGTVRVPRVQNSWRSILMAVPCLPVRSTLPQPINCKGDAPSSRTGQSIASSTFVPGSKISDEVKRTPPLLMS